MSSEQHSTPQAIPKKSGVKRTLLQILFSLIILLCAGTLASYYIKTPPKAKPRVRTPVAPLVTVTPINPQEVIYESTAMGIVTSAQEISLNPRVSGDIISLSPEMVPGGYIKTGDHLASIDPTDYEIALLQLQSDLAKVKSDLHLEMGSQRIATKEFEILGQEVSPAEKELMLRAPQLDIAKAAVANAEAKLQRARIDLSRTKITAPFNGVILSKKIDLGSHVSPTAPIAQLAGTDQFWVKVSLPVEQLQWLDIPTTTSGKGSSAHVFLQETNNKTTYREGHIIRLAASLETEGRMAQLYVAVNDPLCLTPENHDKQQLLLGAFVRVTFTGKKLEKVFVIDRNYLHENNTIWLLSEDNTLEVKTVDIIAKTKEYIYTTTALGDSPHMVTSQIPSPITGTRLQLLQHGERKNINGEKP